MLAVTIATLTGCRIEKYVPVTEYRDRYVSKTDSFIKTDSVYLHDSVSVFAKSDTVYMTKTRYKDRIRFVYHTNTDTVVVRDSIPYPVKVEVEKRQTFIDKAVNIVGQFACVILLPILLLRFISNLYGKH